MLNYTMLVCYSRNAKSNYSYVIDIGLPNYCLRGKIEDLGSVPVLLMLGAFHQM